MSGKDLTFLAEIHNLDNKKTCQESDIPVKIIKKNIDIFSVFIFHNFNNSIFDATFPSELKNADVIPVFKKKDRNNVENYRLISILPNLSKIYERCLYDQMYKYFNHIKLIMPLVVTQKLHTEFHKDQFWVPYFSMSISVVYFLK